MEYPLRTTVLTAFTMAQCKGLFYAWKGAIDYATMAADVDIVSVDSGTGDMPMITRGEWSVDMVSSSVTPIYLYMCLSHLIILIAPRVISSHCLILPTTSAGGNVLPEVMAGEKPNGSACGSKAISKPFLAFFAELDKL